MLLMSKTYQVTQSSSSYKHIKYSPLSSSECIITLIIHYIHHYHHYYHHTYIFIINGIIIITIIIHLHASLSLSASLPSSYIYIYHYRYHHLSFKFLGIDLIVKLLFGKSFNFITLFLHQDQLL